MVTEGDAEDPCAYPRPDSRQIRRWNCQRSGCGRNWPGVATERIAVDGQPRPTEANQGLECTAPFANHPVADVIKRRTFRLARPKNGALRDFHLWPAGTCGDFLNRFAIDRST
ncbi:MULTISPECIES: hypothetical protein [Sinorhizobium]|uniref:hypothetical protein n=1 Tax=Sinorhizobium TaxID=28105 RepID=UPI0013E2C7C8|nr:MULTISPECIES: hypothetical protein [Sinorhizobium]MBO1944317.1 hypothetical protein [Sinorhizobium medicae]